MTPPIRRAATRPADPEQVRVFERLDDERPGLALPDAYRGS